MNYKKALLYLLPLIVFVACDFISFSYTQKTPPKVPPVNLAIPPDKVFKQVITKAYNKFKGMNEGKNADYIPYLKNVNPNLFGISIATTNGKIFTIGDADYAFSIQSVSKPFTAALVMQQEHSANIILEKIGIESTGLEFNSIMAIELLNKKSGFPAGNPLVNAGAIATTSLVKGTNADNRFNNILNYFSDFSAQKPTDKLTINKEVYESEATTNQKNKAMAFLLSNYGRLYSDPLETTDIYTKQCSINITAKQLSIMGATLANYGKNPFTKKVLLNPEYVPKLLSIMLTAGFYDESGLWAWKTGTPAKTGVGGGIIAIVPGKYAIVGFSPKLNASGNSIKASKAIEYIIKKMKANALEK